MQHVPVLLKQEGEEHKKTAVVNNPPDVDITLKTMNNVKTETSISKTFEKNVNEIKLIKNIFTNIETMFTYVCIIMNNQKATLSSAFNYQWIHPSQ